jgi:hypothetical protein
MRRPQLFLCIALSALSACSGDSPTNPPLFIPSAGSPVTQSVTGVLELFADDPAQYAVRMDNGLLVLLISDVATVDASMVGDRVLASGRFISGGDGVISGGELVLENLQRIFEIPTDQESIARRRLQSH